MKKFNLYWLNGKVETVSGNTISDAFNNAGYSRGALIALDYYEEAKEVPMEYKEIILLEGNNRDTLSRGTLIAKQLLKQVADGAKRLVASVAGNEWICDVEITPFEILCRCIERKRHDKIIYPTKL